MKPSFRTTLTGLFLLAIVGLLPAPPIEAFDTPAGGSAAEQLAFDDEEMYILNYYQPLDALPSALAQAVAVDLAALGVPPSAGFYDLRADRWGSLILTVPLVPGAGVGNALTWGELGIAAPADDGALGRAARSAFESFLAASAAQLKVDTSELGSGKVTVHENGRLIQINIGRIAGGVPVEGSWVHGVLNNGNLVLYGTRNWGDINSSSAPTVTEAQAVEAVNQYVAPAGPVSEMRSPVLKLYPMKVGDTPSANYLGTGFDYRLAWEVQLSLDGSHGTWRALVDAQSGDLFSFADQNRYATRQVSGGVQPVSNDGLTVNGISDGVEQPGWPMPFADIWINRAPGSGQPDAVSNSSGMLSCLDGSIATRLAGPAVRMNDTCGAANESAAAGDLDLGSGGAFGLAGWMPPWGTDCALPSASSSPGNTHSSRDGFYEVNRIKEQAKSWLPDNVWIQGQLTANMNINNTCNAFWNGSTINFYRDNNSGCRNTGEEAAVFDHEWGHGMDANDAFPGIAFPGETTADQFAMYRLNTSCVGRGFFKGGPCGGFGDPCLECTGVREVDWSEHASGRPHNVSWVKQPVVTPVDGPLAPRGGCIGAAAAIPVLQTGPCMQLTHCEGQIVSEAVWDLMHRDLAGFEGSAHDLDPNTRLNLVTRLGYLGGGNVNFWYQCVDTPEDGTAGCNSDGGYMNFLAVDDDNGNLLDGTPHMSAIHDSFARHQLACPAPIVTDNGCTAVPATPTLTATALDNGAQVSWSPVSGATEYWLFRADGIHGCEFGKERIAVTTDTQFVDTELRNGREYYYTVEAVGVNDSCRSDASVCEPVTPVSGANLKIRDGSVTTQNLGGDGDSFLDNCESAILGFEIENNGNTPLTNVRIVSVESPSHPAVSAAETLPIDAAASLTDCDTAPATLTIDAQGLSFGDTLVLRIGITADELGGLVRTETVEIRNTESDFAAVAEQIYAFNNFDDIEGWERLLGNYDQLPGGPPTADPAGFFLASSAFLGDQCDAILSPIFRLTPTSTLSLWNQYDTEIPLPAFAGDYYDRANVGILETASNLRTLVTPDGGREYDIPDGQTANGSCFTNGQRGWANAAQPWAESTWSSAALQAGSFAGDVVRLHVVYGTDALASGAGFQFDRVRLTDVELPGPDQRTDICSNNPVAFPDSASTPFETPVTIDVIANDAVNDTNLTVVSTTDGTNGTVVIDGPGPNNTVTYTPDPGFIGEDGFDYTVCNDLGGCATGQVTVVVQCPPEPIGTFSDDVESEIPGYVVQTTRDIGQWEPFSPDLTATSPDTVWFARDDQPGSPTLTAIDHRLQLPPLDLSDLSQMSFNHNFDFARFPLGDLPTAFQSGGVLEISDNGGLSWRDLGPYMTSGGYNGVVDPDASATQNPIRGREAWVGTSSPNTPGDPRVGLNGRLQPMLSVAVDLGAAIVAEFGVSDLDGALVRFRLGGTFQILIDGIEGTGWGVDDIVITGVKEVPVTCNRPPVAVDDGYMVNDGGTLNVPAPGVLANDSDPDGDPLTTMLVSGPSFATTFTFNPDGSFDYTHDGASCDLQPDEDDSFTYKANDGEDDSNVATVSIDVICPDPNNRPEANNDAYTVADNDTLTVAAPGVLSNDTDPDPMDVLTAELVSPPTGGTLVVFNADGSFEYQPADACGDDTDEFFYRACDRADPMDPNRLCDTARVTITITDANQAPTPMDDADSTNEDTAVVIDVLANDSDPDGDALSIFTVNAPSNGAAVQTSPTEVTYTPNPNYNGPDSFSYTVCDECGLCTNATVSITVVPVNDAPGAVDDGYVTDEDTPLVVPAPGVLGNDGDVDGDTLNASGPTSGPSSGGVVLNADGSFTYTPNPDFNGNDSFTYDACDPGGLCDSATVSIIVNPINDPPTAVDDAASTAFETPITIDVLANDSDPENDPLVVGSVTQGANGMVTNNGGDVTYTPNAGFTGVDSFTYEACDNGAPPLCDTATVTVTVGGPANQPPTAADDAATTTENVAVTIDVLANDSDPDGDPLTVGAGTDATSAEGGTIANNGGNVTYTPPAGFSGTDTFTYEACDDGSPQLCDTALVTVTVSPDDFVPCDFCVGDDPVELELTYFGGDCSNSDNTQGSKAECTDFAGPPPTDAPVFIVVSNKEDANDDSDDEFFRGPVDAGQAFMFSAAAAGKNDLPSKVFVHIFNADTESGGVLLQTNEIHTSCSAPLIEGERFGALQLGDAGNPGECPAVTGGRVHGSGHLNVIPGPGDDEDSDTDADSDSDDDSDSDKVHFSFDAKFKNGQLKGKLKLKDKELDIKIKADKDGITSLTAGTALCNGQAPGPTSWEFTAVGTFEQDDVETPGATFRVCGEDNGKPGKGNDRFFLECLTGCAYDTGSRVPDDVIDGGNIHIHDPIAGSGGGGAATSSSASAGPSAKGPESAMAGPGGLGSPLVTDVDVVELEPLLLDELPAGAPLILVAVLHTDEGLALAARPVRLTWTDAGGVKQTATALTDGVGVAAFTVTVPAGGSEFVANVDGVQSNGVYLTGTAQP